MRSCVCTRSIVSPSSIVWKILETIIDDTWVVYAYELLYWCLGRSHNSHPANLQTTNIAGLYFYTLPSTYRSKYLPLKYQFIHHRRMLFIYLHTNAKVHANFWLRIYAHRSTSFVVRAIPTFIASEIHVYRSSLPCPPVSTYGVWTRLALTLASFEVTQAPRDPHPDESTASASISKGMWSS